MSRLLLAAFLALAPLAPAWGAEVVLVQTSPGAFVLEGRSFQGVAAADVTLNFDSARLKDVRVVQGDFAAGGLFVANPLPDGRVRIALVHTRPLGGSGVLAHVTGKPSGSAGSPFSSLSAFLKGEKGNALPVRTALLPLAPPPAPSPGGKVEPPSLSSPSAGEGAPAPVPGKETNRKSGGARVLLPSAGGRTEASAPSAAPAGFPQSGEGPGVAGGPKVPSPRHREPSSTLPAPKAETRSRDLPALFRSEGKTLSLAEKIRLLREPLGEGVRQEPMPAVADGKGSLRILLDGLSPESPPDAAATNSRILGIRPSEGGWEIELAPAEGAREATLLVLGSDAVRTVSLAIAPAVPVDLDGRPGITRGDLDLFRQRPAGFDLNGDGRRDAEDDYVFLVNYLSAGGPADAPPGD